MFWYRASVICHISCRYVLTQTSTGGSTEFYSRNWSILYAVWEMSFYFYRQEQVYEMKVPLNNLPTSTFSPHFAHCQFALELRRDWNELISTSSPQHAHISFCPHFIHWQVVDFCVGNLRGKCWPVDNLRGIYCHICWDYVGMGIILIICGKYVGRSLIFCPWIPHILYILLLVSSTLDKYLRVQK